MSYLTQSRIAANGSMFNRVAQAATEEGFPNGDQWASSTSRQWGAAPGWDDAWESALASHPPETEPDYDPGADESVITDQMILSQVQAMGPNPAP